MQLEAGKKYTDRRGRVYGPLVKTGSLFFGEDTGTPLWNNNGSIDTVSRDMDLVAEYVEPVKATEPAPVESPDDLVIQDRVPARKGIDFGWNVSLKDWDSYKPCETWKWNINDNYAGKMHGSVGNIGRLAVFCYRKDLPPIESPDDWVILDPVVYAEHELRKDIDWIEYGLGWRVVNGYAGTTVEKFLGCDHHCGVRCRRKDLPPVPPQKPVEPEFPQYYVSDEWGQTAYIKRTSENDSVRVMLDGEITDAESPWHMHGATLLASGFLRLVTQSEAEARLKKTRTVVLKEWLCWDDDAPEVVAVEWCSTPPNEELGKFLTYDHAHATGNTRTVEIPVT